MTYKQLRNEVLTFLNKLQERDFSYQNICDYINSQQADFVLFKDFFSRFQSKPNYFSSLAKQKKLAVIHKYMGQVYRQNMDETDYIKDILKKVISDALHIKFETYLEVNRFKPSNHTSLATFYLENSPAYHTIENNLKHKEQYQWELDILNYGSTFKLLSSEITNIFTQSAVVTTKEFWKLCWVAKTSRQLQFRFESLGQQTYLLSKETTGHWKILENMTKTQTNKVEPEYIDYALLERLSSIDREENKVIVNNFLYNNNLLHGIEFIKTAYSTRLMNNQRSILNRIKESYLNSHRLLNTDVINFAVYKSEMELLNKQIKLMCNSIFLSNP